MKNLEQVRAFNALSPVARQVRAGEGEGDALSGYPSLIINNGLLATLAFSLEKKKQHLRIATAIAHHLANLPDGENLIAPKPPTAEGLRDKLTESDSHHLQRCTTEAVAFLTFLKRFAA
ncbi:MAG: type III-B CRISPR module-associated protein Cmr5 [Verrucomicrobia bacterium]|nr:type III-B CRISPR module-associated protein Cmr5 [Verrucomicrobiota bacterium]